MLPALSSADTADDAAIIIAMDERIDALRTAVTAPETLPDPHDAAITAAGEIIELAVAFLCRLRRLEPAEPAEPPRRAQPFSDMAHIVHGGGVRG